MLFAGYPIYSYFTTNPLSNFGAAGIGGTNASGQVGSVLSFVENREVLTCDSFTFKKVPDVPSYRGLIDKDTPNTAMTRTGFDGKVSPEQTLPPIAFQETNGGFAPNRRINLFSGR